MKLIAVTINIIILFLQNDACFHTYCIRQAQCVFISCWIVVDVECRFYTAISVGNVLI